MEMHEVRYFLAVSDTLNFHRAAERCNVTQPALTRAVQKLEAELGAQLFSRAHGHIELTDFGRLMRPHLQEILSRAITARHVASSFLKLDTAPLTLGVMCTIGPVRFVGFLNAFREAHASISVTVTEGVPRHLIELLLDGKLDVALMAQPQPFDSRLVAEPIYTERFGLALCTGHPLHGRNTVQLRDVEGEPYLDRLNCEYANHIDDLCAALGIKIEVAYRSEREDWIMAMVAAGLGVCFAPEYSATLPGVCHRPVTDPELVRHVSVVSVRGRPLPPAAAAFLKAVQGYHWNSAR